MPYFRWMKWLKKKENRYMRFVLAGVSLAVIGLLALLILSLITPRYFLTLDNGLSLLTPKGFAVHQIYDFKGGDEAAVSDTDASGILTLPRSDSREISFQYPEVLRMGNPVSLGEEITQSVDFTISKPAAHGLIQIWNLQGSFEEFLKSAQTYSQTDYLSFKTSTNKVGVLSFTVWDYQFESRGKTIHGLEAFFDDTPYLYRISLFFDKAQDEASVRKLFEEMVQSVQVQDP